MSDELNRLLAVSGFIPHGYCISWSPMLVTTLVASDVFIFLSYATLPVALGYFAQRRPDFPYRGLLWMFAAFIMACGLTHLMGAIVVWAPLYQLDALLKAATAAISVITAIRIWPLMPHALALPSPTQLRKLNAELEKEIAERKRAETALRTAKEAAESGWAREHTQLAAIVEFSNDAIVSQALDGTITSWNQAAEKLYGYAAGEVIGKSPLMLIPPERQAENAQFIVHARKGEAISHFETLRIHSNGNHIDVSMTISPIRDAEGHIIGTSKIVRDITERKHYEDVLRKTNRALTVLSGCNAALVHADDEPKLLSEICRLAVETGGYRMAWIGYAEQDDAKTVRPIARYGHDEGYVDAARITWADGERGRGPVGTAIRTGSPQVFQNLAAHPDMLPWRAQALKRGYQSCIGLPLHDRERFFGALTIYASEPDAFDTEEVKLLGELAEDLGFGITSLREAQARQRIERELAYHSSHDAITGLANRAVFLDRLTQATAHAGRTRRLVGVLAIDLDRFRVIRDSLGHSIGDTLLAHVGKKLAAGLREGDTVARLTGNEFAVVITDVAKDQDVAPIARKLLELVRQPIELEGEAVYVTASVGISVYPRDGQAIEELLSNASAAMHDVKSVGGNAFRFYAPEMNERAFARFALEGDLRRALERDELILHFQPKASLVTGVVTGAEALVRWRHPKHGLVAPADFIPLAEETGLIVPLGEWVIGSVCAQLRSWLAEGLPAAAVAVNLSARQFRQGNLVSFVRETLRANRLEAKFLELEITESVLTDDVDAAVATLRELKQVGVKLSLDDFGTGYSSLSYLKRFPIDHLKIDKSFVRNLATDPDDAAICNAVIGLAHNMKLTVVAEGVETEGQINYLRLHDCDEMQGFHFSKPLPAEEFAQLLSQGKTLALPPPVDPREAILRVDGEVGS